MERFPETIRKLEEGLAGSRGCPNLLIIELTALLDENERLATEVFRLRLDPETLEVLKEHRERCQGRAAALGLQLAGDAYVFSRAPDGKRPAPPRYGDATI